MRGVWIVVAIGVVAAVGFGIYQKMVLAPAEARRATQAEIAQWYTKWRPARECLVGKKPHAQNGYDAIVLHEAIDGVTREQMRECIGFFRRLRRPGTTQSGVRNIERGWLDLEKAMGKLANAHALRVDKKPSRSVNDLREKLGAALEEVDRIYTKLRTAARMKPLKLTGHARIPDVGKAIVVTAGATAIPPQRSVLAGDAVLVQGMVDGVTALAEIRGPKEITISKIATGVVRAASKKRWGVWQPSRRATAIRTGALSAEGRPSSRGTMLAKAPAATALQPAYAFGSDDGVTRVVIYRQRSTSGRGGTAEMVVRSADSGKTWSKPVRVGAGGSRGLSNFDWLQRRFEVVERKKNGAESWSAVTVANPEVVRIPLVERRATRFSSYQGCFAPNASWLMNSSDAGRELRLVSVGGAKQIADATGVSEFLACTDTHALARSAAASKFQILLCTVAGCTSTDKIRRPDQANVFGLFVGEKPIVGVTANDLIVLWSLPGSVRGIGRFEEVPQLRGLVMLGKTPHAITDDEALRLIPLPGKW